MWKFHLHIISYKKNLAWSVLSQGDWLLRVPCIVCQSMQATRLRERIRPIYRLYEGSHIDKAFARYKIVVGIVLELEVFVQCA